MKASNDHATHITAPPIVLRKEGKEIHPARYNPIGQEIQIQEFQKLLCKGNH
jgi:hypothetical protein